MIEKRCHICGNEVRENYYLDKRGYTCYACSREINMQKKSNKNYVESFEIKKYDINYLELPLVEKTIYLDNELKSAKKQIDELITMLSNLKNEMNREFLKKGDDDE